MHQYDGMRSRRTPTNTPFRVNACSACNAARVCYILLFRSCVFVRNNYVKNQLRRTEVKVVQVQGAM